MLARSFPRRLSLQVRQFLFFFWWLQAWTEGYFSAPLIEVDHITKDCAAFFAADGGDDSGPPPGGGIAVLDEQSGRMLQENIQHVRHPVE